jgi:tetratricopeptide (TPR) repeat protein
MDPNFTADQYRFAELEYQTLRKEIEDAKGRMFKIIAGEAILLPSVQVFLEWKGSNEASPIYLMMPFLIFVFVSRFLYENNSTIRAGCYIRSYIEPIYSPQKFNQKFLGWEEWLEIERFLEFRSKRKFERILNVISFIAKKLWSYLVEIKTSLLPSEGSHIAPHKSYKPHRLVESYLKEGFYWLSAFYYIVSLYFIISIIIESDLSLYFRLLVLLIYIFLGLHLIYIISDVWISTSPRLPSQKELKDDINILNKAIDLCPTDPYLRNTKGEMYLKIGISEADLDRIKSALECFEIAINLNPGYPEAWNNKGMALKALGLRSEAE